MKDKGGNMWNCKGGINISGEKKYDLDAVKGAILEILAVNTSDANKQLALKTLYEICKPECIGNANIYTNIEQDDGSFVS